MIASQIQAQDSSEFLNRSYSYPAFTPEPAYYNLKWGRLTGRMYATVQAEYNDNINLSQSAREDDLSIGPYVGIDFLWPASRNQFMQVELGLGYRWYVNHPFLNTFIIVPNTRLNHRIIIENVEIRLRDNFAIQTDPTQRGEISGGDSQTVNFRRFNNTAGLTATWHPVKPLSVWGAYDYLLDRSLTGEFGELDRDDHILSTGVDYRFSPQFTAGLSGLVTFTQFREEVQNNGLTYTVGPVATYRPSKFLTLNAAVGYTVSTYDSSGTVNDTSDFHGVTYQASIRHTVNKNISHELRLARSVLPGFRSNFTDTWDVQYGIRTRLARTVSLNSSVIYENLSLSGPAGEMADRYLFYVGSACQLARRWIFGLSYSFAFKDSDQAGRDYRQNRVTLDLTHQF